MDANGELWVRITVDCALLSTRLADRITQVHRDEDERFSPRSDHNRLLLSFFHLASTWRACPGPMRVPEKVLRSCGSAVCAERGTCTHQISAPLGEINSPNYPDAYPSRKDCAWLFTTTPGHRLKLIFNDFELEPHQECAYDHISLYDGDSTDAPTLGRFCGAKVPHPILSTTNRMYMVFKSDASVQRKGFKASHSTACGGRLLATGRTVEHLYSHAKYGDQNYENREDCDWLVEAESGRVRLRFLTFELEHEQDCGYDFVQLFDGYDDSAPQLGRFCGNKMPGEFTSSSGSLLLRFRSDDNINAKGFSAAYSAVDAAGGDLSQQHAPTPPAASFAETHHRDRRLRLHRRH
ncbi:dorsal-ventral patterning tolloid-like protein 1 [Amblyomma americanum]